MKTSPGWSASDIPDLSGQTWLVTGATRGLGLATARLAVDAGAHVIVTGRRQDDATAVADSLGDATPLALDLADLSCVRSAADAVGDIDVLVDNAGGTTTRRTETVDGFEWHLGVNMLGPFLLTNLLLPRIRRRVVIVTSVTWARARLDLSDLHYRRRHWRQTLAYMQSKKADVWWASELAHRAARLDPPVGVQLAHPGWVDTSVGNPARTRVGGAAVSLAARIGANPAQNAALTTIYAATQDLPPCSLVGPLGPGGLRGAPGVVSSKLRLDPADTRDLWDIAVELTGSPDV